MVTWEIYTCGTLIIKIVYGGHYEESKQAGIHYNVFSPKVSDWKFAKVSSAKHSCYTVYSTATY